ncbi:hypothetical protein KKHLCK_00530 [Candidatus Electrothrix laxa]
MSRLRCPENDVRAVDEILCSPDFGQFTETFVFRNAPSYEILPRLNSVLTEAGKDDLVLIYFSGHGKLNRLGHLCLATANTDSKALEATTILASTIKSYFDLSYSRKKILLLDCCYSGAAGEEFARTKGGVDEELQLMSGGQGTFIMTASSGLQTSVEKEGDQYGLFTKHLVQGICSGEADKNEDGFVDMHELYDYVHENVTVEGSQEPMKFDLHAKGKLVIACSGRELRERRQQESRKKLYELAAQRLLTDNIVAEAVNILFIPDKKKNNKERECDLLIEKLAVDKISPADFVERWVTTCFVHTQQQTNAIEDEPISQTTPQQQRREQREDSSILNRKRILSIINLLPLLCTVIFLYVGGVYVMDWPILSYKKKDTKIFKTAIGINQPKLLKTSERPDNTSERNDTGTKEQLNIVTENKKERQVVEQKKRNLKFGRFHALLIGNQNYQHLKSLKTPLNDVQAVSQILKEQYGFEVKLIADVDRDTMMRAFSELRASMTEEDNLLIYYAGHGSLDSVTGSGYWQPVDAERDNDVQWIWTSRISSTLKAIQATHVLVVSDACFSGKILTRDSDSKLSTGIGRSEWLQRMFRRRSRNALTSGGNEPVQDSGGGTHSVFGKAFLEVLTENREILDGSSLFERIKKMVILNAAQTPMYGPIPMTDHEGGDFLLVPKLLQEEESFAEELNPTESIRLR